MRAAGASRIVAVVKEDVGTEVADFRARFWSQEIFLDSEMCFFKAIHGGEVNKPAGMMSLLALLANPWTKSRSRQHLLRNSKTGIDKNLIGEGFITGGLYVVKTDGKAAYVFPEEHMGDHAPLDDIVEAVKAAEQGEMYNVAPLAFLDAAAEAGPSRKTWKEWAGRSDGPDGYVAGDITRGIVASLQRSKREDSRG